MQTNSELVTVFTTTQATEAEMVKNLLEAEGIACEVAGETQGGWSGILEVPVLVKAEDEERARAVLASRAKALPGDEA